MPAPVSLETFAAYGQAFRERMLPELEEKQVVSLDRAPEGLSLGSIMAKRLRRGGSYSRLGSRTSNMSLATWQVCRRNSSRIAPAITTLRLSRPERSRHRRRSFRAGSGWIAARSWRQRATRRPQDGIEVSQPADGQATFSLAANQASAIGARSGFAVAFLCRFPEVFHYLPERLRIETVRKSLGPSGGWFIRDKVIGKVPCISDARRKAQRLRTERVHLTLAQRTAASGRL